jgi:hypothetical protein
MGGTGMTCAHVWPDELEPETTCLHCGLAYADWSEVDDEMSDPIPVPAVQPTPGSRLDDLLAVYAGLKPQADEIATRLKTVTDAIKTELLAAAPGAQRVDVAHTALAQPLRLSYVETWTLDTKRLKAENPALYVAYARKGGSWQLRGRSA